MWSGSSSAAHIAFGNVVGSNIADILLILGASAVILPMTTTKEARSNVTVLIGTSRLMLGVLSKAIGRWTGAAARPGEAFDLDACLDRLTDEGQGRFRSWPALALICCAVNSAQRGLR